jgi:biofilm protein TabA
MILDTLAQSRKYAALSPRFQKAFDFLEQFDGRVGVGRVAIDGDAVYALVQKYTTQGHADRSFEVHRKYIDIQYVHAGRETILWAPLAALTTVTQPYKDDSDAALFAAVPAITPLHLGPGLFAILFPEDGHLPCCLWEQPCEVLKVVVKVRIEGR